MRRHVLFLSLAALAAAPATAGVAAAANENTCVFMISMTSGTDVNNLDFVVNYAQTGGNVEGTMTHPDCARALPGATAFAGFHDDDAGHLNVGIIRLNYFSAPVDLAGCRIFYDGDQPVPSDFSVQVTNAGRDGGDNNVVPVPSIAVTDVDCPGELPNPTTTTTLPDTTTTTLPTGSGDCGFPVSDGDTPKASDALFALKAAVGVAQCPLCVCDINDSGGVTASDALGILRAAVGISTPLDCPAC